MPASCPTAEQLAAFDRGELSADLHDKINLHLEACPECARKYELLEVAADPLVEQLRRPLPPEILQDDEDLQQLVNDVMLLDTAQVARCETGLDTLPHLTPGLPSETVQILAPPQEGDEIGRLGGYRVLALLGTGGMGMVFRAEDPLLKRIVALKVMKTEAAADASARERFLREAQSAAALHHDNVVTIYQVGKDRGVPFLAMEHLEGESLRDRLKRLGRLDPPQALRITREAAAGLAAAHAKGLIHRDIKPDNLWLESGGDRAKVLDFGLARATDSELNLTRSGMIIGTPNYLSPEQACGTACDHRSDLFSLGVVLYEMLTGKRPFQRDSLIATIRAIEGDTPPPPSTLYADVPPAASEIVSRLMAKQPDQRFASGKELIEAIDQCLTGVQNLPHTATPARTHRTYAATLSVAAFLLVVGILAAAAYVIRFKTPEGEWVLEQFDRDAKVIVRQGDRVVKQLEVSKGRDHTLTLAMGTYEVDIVGKSDQVTIESGRVTVERNGKVVARLEKVGSAVAKGNDSDPEMSSKNFALKFDDSDFSLKTERLGLSRDSPLTLECTIISQSQREACNYLTLGDDRGGTVWLTSPKPGEVAFGVATSAGRLMVRSVDQIDITKPVRIAGIYEPHEIRLYVNGRLQGRHDVRERVGECEILRIAPRLGDVYFRGVLDEARVSNSARYRGSYEPVERFANDDATLVLYHFDEGENDVIRDSSGNARHLRRVSQRWVRVGHGATTRDSSRPTDEHSLERDAAETILRGGGSLVIWMKNSTEPHEINSLDELPRGKWSIHVVGLGPHTKVEDLHKLKSLPNLAQFGTGQCTIPAREVLSQIAGIEQMYFLGMSGAGLTSDDLPAILKFPRLQFLQAYNSRWDDEDVKQLVQLKELRQLNVGGTQITDAVLRDLVRLPKLKELFVAGTDVSFDGLKHLVDCKSLRFINVEKTRVTEDDVAAFRKLRPDCTVQIKAVQN